MIAPISATVASKRRVGSRERREEVSFAATRRCVKPINNLVLVRSGETVGIDGAQPDQIVSATDRRER